MDRTPARFALFDTAIGRCGIAWSERGVLRVQLPERNDLTTQERLLKGLDATEGSDPPAPIKEAIAKIMALLAGDRSDLSTVALDLETIPEFSRRVYHVTRDIPPGSILTYGEVAARLGEPGAARTVGQALGQNPVPIIVPCHRVVAAGGKIGGFSARGGTTMKTRLLSIESRWSPALE